MNVAETGRCTDVAETGSCWIPTDMKAAWSGFTCRVRQHAGRDYSAGMLLTQAHGGYQTPSTGITTSFFLRRKVPESDARSMGGYVSTCTHFRTGSDTQIQHNML